MATVSVGCKIAKPIFSTNFCESHVRVMSLYRAYYRYLPYIVIESLQKVNLKYLDVKHFDIPKSELDCRRKLREYFYKNACITDLRVIDILVLKGFINLKEITHQWQQKGHIMAHWYPNEIKPCDFIGKFLANED